jgi:drug/metabolite transporter (DMT)-like permease
VNDQAPSRAWLPVTAGATAVLAWSFGPILVREAAASTQTVVFFRMLFAQPVMLAATLVSRGRVSWTLLRRAAVPGVLFAGSIITSFASYSATSIANATLIGALQPAVILLVAPKLFGERSSRHQVGWAALAFVGMTIVVLGAGSASGASLHGDLLAVINLAIWVVYFIRVKQLRDEGLHAWAFLSCVFFVALVVMTPWVLLTSHDLGSLHGRGYVFIALMAIGPGLLGHGSMTWAQRHLDITLASLLTLVQPVLSTLWAWWLYSERLVPVQVAGAIVALGGLVGVVRHTRAGERAPTVTLPVTLSGAVE